MSRTGETGCWIAVSVQSLILSQTRSGRAGQAGLITANLITTFGFVLGCGFYCSDTRPLCRSFRFFMLNRICDGLRWCHCTAYHETDFGGYLDIVLDFIFYALIPLGFAIAEPEQCYSCSDLDCKLCWDGIIFSSFCHLLQKSGMSTEIRGKKSLYYLGGLTEGTETIAVLLLPMCIWPQYFPIFAYIFAFLCGVTTVTRIVWAYISFKDLYIVKQRMI